MKRFLIGLGAVFAVVGTGVPAAAGTQDRAVIALHLAPYVKGEDPCHGPPNETPPRACSDYVVQGDLNTPYSVYLMIAHGDSASGVAALSCGILYNGGAVGESTMSDGVGVDVLGWDCCPCTPLTCPDPRNPGDWPASGGGNRFTWYPGTDCQRTVVGSDGVQAVIGAFYVTAYSDDFFAVIPNNDNVHDGVPEFQVGDCGNKLSNLPYPDAAGYVSFSEGAATPGCNPCLGPCGEAPGVPVRAATWGKIKQRYR